MEITTLPIAKIRVDGGTQMRAIIDDDTVAEYAERYRSDAKMPPLVVFYDGENYWLADGFHRLQALRAANKPNAIAEIHSGTQREAVLHSCGANAIHGLRRTNADKRRAVETMLRDAEWSRWSDRRIAQVCGVSPQFVHGMRAESVANGRHLEEPTVPTTRTGSDGKNYPAPRQKPVVREQTEAPAPYREGGATKQAEEPPRSEPEPQPKPAARPVRPPESTTNAQAREAHVSAFALCGFMDRASMAINEQQHHIDGFLLDENDAGKLRVSIGNLRLALDDLEERVS